MTKLGDFWLSEDTLEPSDDEDSSKLGVRVCEKLPEGFPVEWRDLRLSVGVGLILTDYNCVYQSFFDEYAVSSVEDAVARVAMYDGVFLAYRFYVDCLAPAFSWDADLPLFCRNAELPIRRQPDWDNTYFEIRVEPTGPWVGRPYLRAGGRSPADATTAWMVCAKALRPLYRKWHKKE